MAHGLSVAQVAAVINIAIIIVKLSYPMWITVAAVVTLRERPNVATWSVFGQLVNGSLWATVLGTDTNSTKRVDKKIWMYSALSTGLSILLGVAAAVTPLGLRDAVRLQEPRPTMFRYVKDTSSISSSTRARDGYVHNRICGWHTAEPCPGFSNGYSYGRNDTHAWVEPIPGVRQNHSLTTSIAQNITEAFTSATNNQASTVAGIFDIQYRAFYNWNNASEPEEGMLWFDGGQSRTQGVYQFTQDFIVDSKVQAIEGLVVSTSGEHGPGVGFRNHTLPSDVQVGYTWQEDLLWLTPETSCTNLNVSFDFALPVRPGDKPAMARLTDRGGLADIVDSPEIDLNDTQSDPKLLQRSWKAATLTNRIVLSSLNETMENTYVGKEYRLGLYDVQTTDRQDYSGIHEVGLQRYGYIDEAGAGPHPGLPSPLSVTGRESNSLDYTNDHVMLRPRERTNISVAGAVGGILLVPATSADRDPDSTSDLSSLNPGSNWTRPLYSCMSGVKASVQTVTFYLNGTASLQNLQIQSVRPSETNVTWGVEKTGREVTSFGPFWGVVAAHYTESLNLYTLQRPHLWLPAGKSITRLASTLRRNAAAGADAPLAALKMVYDPEDFLGNKDDVPLSGDGNWPLMQKWAILGANASTAGSIVDNMWVDVMANTVVGTKSPLSQNNGSDLESVLMMAAAFKRGVQYNWVYAIPALILATSYIGLVSLSCTLAIRTGLSFSRLRFMLNQSTAGRSVTTERFHGDDETDIAATKEWARTRGEEIVQIPTTWKTADHKQEQALLPSSAEE